MTREFKRIWIDLDNSPHVPFFCPIIEALQRMGYSVVVSARNAFQVSELTTLHELKCKAIGRHYGRNKFMKMLGLMVRSAQLLPFAIRGRPDLAVSHGSRAQILGAKLLGITTVLIADYEHAKQFIHTDTVIVPEAIPIEIAGKFAKRVLRYPGLKEDVYISNLQPDPTILAGLGIDESEIIVTVRPPATEAHYHNPESDKLFNAVMKFLGTDQRTRLILLPRNDKQKNDISRDWSAWLESAKMVIPPKAVDGLNLIWHSDLVISGGGTMNREAAALGLPVYSIFRGKIGSVDKYLVENGRLVLIETIQDVQGKIILTKKPRPILPGSRDRSALDAIVNGIVSTLNRQQEIPSGRRLV
jgi:uncharacterized protein